jgi:hypothetical protein
MNASVYTSAQIIKLVEDKAIPENATVIVLDKHACEAEVCEPDVKRRRKHSPVTNTCTPQSLMLSQNTYNFYAKCMARKHRQNLNITYNEAEFEVNVFTTSVDNLYRIASTIPIFIVGWTPKIGSGKPPIYLYWAHRGQDRNRFFFDTSLTTDVQSTITSKYPWISFQLFDTTTLIRKSLPAKTLRDMTYLYSNEKGEVVHYLS